MLKIIRLKRAKMMGFGNDLNAWDIIPTYIHGTATMPRQQAQIKIIQVQIMRIK
jgi:hypothetical protein